MQMLFLASGSNGKCLSKEPSVLALHRWANLPRAVRPFAASAPPVHIEPRAARTASDKPYVIEAKGIEASLKELVFIEARIQSFRKALPQVSLQSVSWPQQPSLAARVIARQSKYRCPRRHRQSVGRQSHPTQNVGLVRFVRGLTSHCRRRPSAAPELQLQGLPHLSSDSRP